MSPGRLPPAQSVPLPSHAFTNPGLCPKRFLRHPTLLVFNTLVAFTLFHPLICGGDVCWVAKLSQVEEIYAFASLSRWREGWGAVGRLSGDTPGCKQHAAVEGHCEHTATAARVTALSGTHPAGI